MKFFRHLFLLAFGLAGLVCAADPALKLDPKRVINASNSFLKEAEPEMTAEEYALYEKISSMLESQPDFALKLLEGMLSDATPPSPAFEFILGNVYFLAGQKDRAQVRFLSAVKRYPSFLRAWKNLGVLYYTTERYTEAIPCLAKAVSLGDHESGTFGLLGYCLERSDNAIAAEVAYLQALAGDPENTDWMEGLLRIYTADRQYGRAESLVNNLIKLHPAEARYWLADANILLAENRKREALVMLEVAAGAGFAGPDELNLLSDLYADQGLEAEAAKIYEKLLTLTPDLGERKLLRYAQVLITAGRLAQAEQVLGRLPVNLTPAGQLNFLRTKSDLLAAGKQWPAARQELEKLLKISPLDGKALLSLGHTYVAETDFVHASFAFEAAYRIQESTYSASIELANIALKNRDYEKAAEYLRKALSIAPTDALEDYLARVETLVGKAGAASP